MRTILFFLCGTLLAGCMANGPAFTDVQQTPDNKALVYIYRMPSTALSGRDARFYLNGKRICKLSADGYCNFFVPPGDYELSQEWPIDVSFGQKVVTDFHTSSGETHYFRFATGSSPALMGITLIWELRQVSPDIGHTEITFRHLQAADEDDPTH